MSTVSDKAVLNAIFNPLLPANDDSEQETSIVEEIVVSENENKAKVLEISGVKAAESYNLDEALNYFSQAIDICPERASCYNNRAQAFRLKGDIEHAKQDLNKAVELGSGSGKALCQAYVQRALIARLENRESDAKSDFEMAAKLGSAFAKTQLVMMNPYAAMCNKMLTDVFEKLKRGEAEDAQECHLPA